MTRPVEQSCNLGKLPEAVVREMCTFGDPETGLELSRVNKALQRMVQNSWPSLVPHFITGHHQTPLHPRIPPAEQLKRLRLAESSRASIVRKMTLDETCAEGCLKISRDGKKALSAGPSKGITLWDLTTGKCTLKLGQDAYYRWIHMSGDGKRAYATATKIVENVEKKILRVWDLMRGELLQELPLGNETTHAFRLEVSDDGKKALYTVGDVLSLFDLDTGEELSQTQADLMRVAMCCNGERALGYRDYWFARHCLEIWDITQSPGRCIYLAKEWGSVVGMSHDGARALVQFDERLDWLDLISGKILKNALVLGNIFLARSFSMNADETRAVIGQDDRLLEHWDLTTGKKLQTLLKWSNPQDRLSNIGFVKINPNGTRAISLTSFWPYDDGVLQLWDLHSGECLQTIGSSQEDLGRSMEMDAYGMTALTRSISGKITVWDCAPHPDERLCAVARAFRQHSPAAEKELKKLPGSVQNAIARPKPWIAVQCMKKLATTPPARWLQRYLDQHKEIYLAKLRDGLHEYTERADNTMAQNIETYIVNSGILPVIAKIFTRAEKTAAPAKLPPSSILHVIYDFLEDEDKEKVRTLLTEKNEEEFLPTSKMIIEDAQVRFLNLPENIKQLIFAEIVRQRAAAGTLPENAPDNYGELSFYNIEGYSTTPAEKSAAIMAVWNRLHTPT